MRFSLAISGAILSLGVIATQAQAFVASAYPFYSPAGWTVGTTGSTSEEWAADGVDHIDGIPNVSFNDAGAGLTQPTLTAAAPGFVAGSGGFYSFSGGYTVTAAISNSTITPPTSAGTYVIIQTFATIDPDDGQGNSGTVLGSNITDTLGNAITGLQHVRSTIYGFQPNFPSSFGPVDVQATIDEYWLPNFTANFLASLNIIVDSSVQGVRVDSIITSAGASGSLPFTPTTVPEPASLGVLGSSALLLAARRRRKA